MSSEVIAEPAPDEYKTPLPRPLLIGAGSLVLASIMLITAFSLGAWWANGQETTPASFGFGPGFGGGPGAGGQGQGFGQQQNQNFGGFGGAQGAGNAQNAGPDLSAASVDKLPRSADVVGTISSYGRSTLTIATRAGNRFVTVDSETRIYLPDGSDGTTQALQRGQGVAIVTKPSQDGRFLVADVIALLGTGN